MFYKTSQKYLASIPDGRPGGDQADDGGHPPLQGHAGQPHVHGDPPVLVHDLLFTEDVGNNFSLRFINHGIQRSASGTFGEKVKKIKKLTGIQIQLFDDL